MEIEKVEAYLPRILAAVVALVLVLIAVLSSTFTVEQYEQGVVTTWGKVSRVEGPGIGFKIPFAQSVTKIRTDILSMSPARDEKGGMRGVNTYTSDNQEVDIFFTVFYRVPADKVAFVYENVQDYKSRLYSLANDRLKAEMGRINLAHFAEHRAEIRDKIHSTLKADSKQLGLDVTDFQFTDVQYTPSFRQAVEAAAAAKANVETREQEKQQALRIAERARIDAEGKANAAREEAKGKGDAIVSVATAEARAIQMRGEAEAKAIRAQAEALQQNQKLVELRKAEKWDGKLPVQMLSNVLPMMQFKAEDGK